MDNVERRLDQHETRISTLEQGNALMLQKLTDNDSRWQRIEQKLEVVDHISDIHQTMSHMGALFGGLFRGLRIVITTVALIAGCYAAIHSGNLSMLSTFIGQLMGIN